jgi:hypothetical protein
MEIPVDHERRGLTKGAAICGLPSGFDIEGRGELDSKCANESEQISRASVTRLHAPGLLHEVLHETSVAGVLEINSARLKTVSPSNSGAGTQIRIQNVGRGPGI